MYVLELANSGLSENSDFNLEFYHLKFTNHSIILSNLFIHGKNYYSEIFNNEIFHFTFVE